MPDSSPDATVSLVLDDAVARLLATAAFGPDDGSSCVGWGAGMDILFPEAVGVAAAIEYAGSTETPIADDDFRVRDGRYTLTLAVREEDPRTRVAALDQLSAIARDALSNVPLGGICQPFFCRLNTDAPAAASLPEGRLAINGTFRYTIDDDADRDELGDDYS
jgi:hypothetical protein